MVKFRSTVASSDWSSGAIGAALAIVLGLLFFGSRIGWDFTHLSYDIPFALRNARAVEDVVILYLDQESHEFLQQPSNLPWDRSLHARLLDQLKQQGARLVVFDIIFDDPQGLSPATQRLVEAVKNHGGVVLAADYEINTTRKAEKPVLPFDEILNAAAGWGNDRWRADLDLGIRSHYPNLTNIHEIGFFPTLAWTAARLEGAKEIPEREMWLNYYGPPGTIPNLSYYIPFDRETPSPLPTNFFANKVVFIGSKAATGFTGEGKDEMATPYTVWGKGLTPGVEIHATAFLNLIQRDWISRLPLGMELAMLALSGLLIGLTMGRLPPLKAVFLAAGGALAVFLTSLILMWYGRLWFNWMLIAGVQIPVALVWTVAHNSLQAYIAKKALQRSLALYVSPARAKQVIKNPELLKPGAEEKEVTLLFTDIADFSTISQIATPEQLVVALNEYFQTALDSIHKTDGTVVKFIGDAIFAMWNAPEDQPDHQELACRAVAQLHADLARFNRVLQERFTSDDTNFQFVFRTRIGLHTGKAFVGNFGSAQRFDYTAIGDAVNFCSRLESLNKYVGTDVLLSNEFHQAICHQHTTRFVGNFKPKGFIKHLPIYELIGAPELREPTRAWREAFADGWRKFSQRDFAGAEAAFRETSRRRGEWHAQANPGAKPIEDGPSRFYLRQIEQFKLEPQPPEWRGEVEPEGK